MTRAFRIELRLALLIIFFIIFVVTFQRFQLSDSVIEQYKNAKIEKNTLLINTIEPIVSLNMSFELLDANKEYLDEIARNNPDVIAIELFAKGAKIIYTYPKEIILKKESYKTYLNFSEKILYDKISQEPIGRICIYFSDKDIQKAIKNDRNTTFQIFGFTFFSLFVFLYIMRSELSNLRELTNNVINYDPQKNNFPMQISTKSDEVSIINNAIVQMIHKISIYTKQLDEINTNLENMVEERTNQLRDANKKLQELTFTDDLTHLANRRKFLLTFEQYWELAKRKNIPLTLVMCDIDHFKRINDTYGHKAGDIVLQKVAQTMQKTLHRESDFLSRLGGEEFVLLLFDTDVMQAKTLCEKIQENLKKIPSYIDEEVYHPVTLSFGIAEAVFDNPLSKDKILSQADVALYKAKDLGRDTIVIFSPDLIHD